jgi:hypothetical protein
VLGTVGIGNTTSPTRPARSYSVCEFEDALDVPESRVGYLREGLRCLNVPHVRGFTGSQLTIVAALLQKLGR